MGSGAAASPNPDISPPEPVQGVHTSRFPRAVMSPAAAGNDVSAAAIEGTAATTPRARASMWLGRLRFTVPPPLLNTSAEPTERRLPPRRSDPRHPPRCANRRRLAPRARGDRKAGVARLAHLACAFARKRKYSWLR